jgi:hypothetical protein
VAYCIGAASPAGLARYHRRIGVRCRLLRSTAPNGLHTYAVERILIFG